MNIRLLRLLLLVGFAVPSPAPAAELPPISVGLDAYRQWDRWCYQRVGARAYMRSTYDRQGRNHAADTSNFLYQLADDFNVTLDVEGPGVLCFARYNHWHGSPWHYIVDGKDHIVQETSTADPNKPVPGSVFMPEHLFPNPLAWTWSITKGADLNWVPMPFQKSFRMAYSRTRYGTGYYIYQQFVPGIPLSQPITAWDGQTPPGKDVLDLINRSGADIVPKEILNENGRRGIFRVAGGKQALAAKGSFTAFSIEEGRPTMLRALEFSVPREHAVDFGRARLRITWDGRKEPSVDAPVALFFGAGTLSNRDDREYLVKAFPVSVRYDANDVHMACYFPMPFFQRAKIELIGNGETDIPGISCSARFHMMDAPPEHVGYFHATYRDHAQPERGKDLVLLDTREAEGGGAWSGAFIGTSFIFSDRAVLTTLEGDPRFFFDDSESPQAYGTGTEEWGGGGDYWGGLNMTLPFAGHPVGARKASEAKNDEDKVHSAYRFLLGDLMPFGKNARIHLEHGGENESDEHYQTVTYWYGAPAASLVKTDELKIGDSASERAHSYHSPDASDPYDINSRYELGPDTLPGEEGGPLARPADFAEFEFEAEPALTYQIWVRGRNLDGNNMSDAFWLQFDDDIGTTKTAASYRTDKGFGNWLDRFPAGTSAWSSSLPQEPPKTIIFTHSGKHRVRIQPRHRGHQLEQIWLSAGQKELPPPTHFPVSSADHREIVLNAVQATNLNGGIKLITAAADGPPVLEIRGHTAGPGRPIEIYPAHNDRGRKTTGTSEFTVKLDPQNLGVLLRRKLDYQFPHQRAEVSIADASTGEPRDWQPAGTWYLAGSNTYVYSNPPEELGATRHEVKTSNRRFRDDEFLVARALTQGRTAIRVRVKFTPVNIPLFPDRPLDEQAWSEIRYDAYCFVRPRWTPE
jgi:hypothetical protein